LREEAKPGKASFKKNTQLYADSPLQRIASCAAAKRRSNAPRRLVDTVAFAAAIHKIQSLSLSSEPKSTWKYGFGFEKIPVSTLSLLHFCNIHNGHTPTEFSQRCGWAAPHVQFGVCELFLGV
jgi:hypothetical protein